MMWGPWITTYLPDVGTYIQAEVEHDDTLDIRLEEGIIAGFNGTVTWFVGETPKMSCPWTAIRWRERKLPEVPPVKLKRKVEA